MDKKQAGDLLQKYNDRSASPEEIRLLENWYKYEFSARQKDPVDLDYLSVKNEMWDKIMPTPGKRIWRAWPRAVAAACLLFFLAFGTFFLLQPLKKLHPVSGNEVGDIAPGSDKATLTLANGQRIFIAGARAGLLTNQGTTAIHITPGNKLVYSRHGNNAEIIYNTLTTPKGGQHALILADGTRVWLDANSSITFPVAFPANERSVKITGQVYFEVAHDPSKPFRVITNRQALEVLGTHFNVNAYDDEPALKTTLFKGMVKVSTRAKSIVLKPGQQSQIVQDHIHVVENADLEEALAWHNGIFQFHDADIKTVLRQLSRWYDVDISYQGNIPSRTFSGGIYRNQALKLTDILNNKKINFRAEGNKIIITP